ncbi:universal stress protein [Sphingomicrobium sp. XHP0235]|uniref:universal stress protein n=1 Tax=Sphingomicrobium aquimarinum TaxID=3133971 RepID=UPI0031FE4FC4
MKTLLLHVQADPRVEARVDNAISIARACNAHIDALHVTAEETLASFESFGGIDADRSGAREFAASEDQLETRVREMLRKSGVDYDFERVTGSSTSALARYAAFADMIVAGRKSRLGASDSSAITMLGDLLISLQVPIFIRGDEQSEFDPTAPAIIAWDGSFEAANAVRDGIFFLQKTRAVHVVRVSEGAREVEPGMYPLTRVMQYLSRNGVHAEYSRIAEIDGKTSTALLDFAEQKQAGLIAMGGYTQSRLGQRIFGGLTRTMLKGCPVALLMAH